MLARNGTIYFTEEEMQCKGTGVVKLAPGFGDTLMDLRIEFNAPMSVISGCRSTAHNKRVGGAQDSFHIYDKADGIGTCAVDVATPDAQYRTRLVKLALSKGWCVGIKRTMVHLDRRTDYYPAYKQVIFVY